MANREHQFTNNKALSDCNNRCIVDKTNKKKDMQRSPCFLRLTDLETDFYPTPGDIVLQLLLPKYVPNENDLTLTGSWPVVVIFSDKNGCFSLPIWDSPVPPEHIPYVELERDLEYVGSPRFNVQLPTRIPGNHFYALLTPVYAAVKTGIEWTFPKYANVPAGWWLWPAEPFCNFSLSAAKLPWYQWKVYYTLFPALLPPQYPAFSTRSDAYSRGKLRCKEYENVGKVMDIVNDLTEFWREIEKYWTKGDKEKSVYELLETGVRALGENVGKRVEIPIAVQSGHGGFIGPDEEHWEKVPDWRDILLLPLPSATPGETVPEEEIVPLYNIMDVVRHGVNGRHLLGHPAIWKDSEKYLLRALPVDEVPRCNLEASKSRVLVDKTGVVSLKPMTK
jgi:hypothetical protein